MKRIISFVLVLSMVLATVPTLAFAQDGTRDELSAIRESLENADPVLKEQYPGGLFAIPQIAAEVDENAGEPLTFYIARYGGTQGEAKLSLRFQDYSAQYGKDYTAEVEKSVFSKDKIEPNENAVPIMYMFSQENPLTGEDATYEDLVDQYGEESVQHMEELVGEYIEATAKDEEKSAGETEKDAAAADKDAAADEDVPADEDAAADEDNEEAEAPAQSESVSAEEPIYQSAGEAEEKSPLYALNDQVSQFSDSNLTFGNFITGENSDPETARISNELMAEAFPCAETEVVFEDGETLKKVTVYPNNDDESNGDRVFVAYINGSGDGYALDVRNNAQITIKDDEAYVSPYVYVDSGTVTGISEDSDSFKAELRRNDPLYQLSTVTFTAITDTNNVLIQGNVVFMPGMDTQTIEVPMTGVAGSGAKTIYLSLANAVGCDVSENYTTVEILSASNDSSDGIVTSAATGKKLKAYDDNNPFRADGEEFYDHFEFDVKSLFSTGLSFNGGPCKGKSQGYKDGYYYFDIPDHGCGCSGTYVGYEHYFPVGVMPAIKSISIDWYAEDYEGVRANYTFLSLTKDSVMKDNNDTFHGKSTIAFVGDHKSGQTTTIDLQTGNVDDPGGARHDYSPSNFIKNGGSQFDYPSIRPAYFTWEVYKNSGGFNGMHNEIKAVRFNYMEVPFEIVNPDPIDGVIPGTLAMKSRDNKSQGTKMSFYGREKISLVETTKNDNYELTGMEFTINNKTCKINNEADPLFDPKGLTLDLAEIWNIGTYGPFHADNVTKDNDFGTIKLKPIYSKKAVSVTIKSDKNGGMKLTDNTSSHGGPWSLNSGDKDKKITLYAADSITIEPYDQDERYNFAGWGGSSSPIGQSGAQYQIPFSMTDEKSTIKLEPRDYTIYPKYSAEGTFVRLSLDKTVSDINIPLEQIQADIDDMMKNNDMKAGDVISIDLRKFLDPDIYHSVSTKHVPTWTVNTENHPWKGLNIGGWTLYYEIHNGDNEITLSFEDEVAEMVPDVTFEDADAEAVPAVTGKVLKYNASLLNPPVLVYNSGEPLNGYEPAAGATVSAGSFYGLTKSDGTYSLHWTEGDEASGENISYPMMLNSGNEYITALINSNHINTLALLKPIKQTGRAGDVVVDFYASEEEPQPVGISVLVGPSGEIPSYEKAETQNAVMGQVNMSDSSVGFRLNVHDQYKKLKSVVFTIYDKEMAKRNEYTVDVQPDSYDYTVDLTSVPTELDTGEIVKMPLNALLNFHDGDRVFVDLKGAETVTGADGTVGEVEVSYGEFDTGITFHEVPGQDIELQIPNIGPDETSPDLPTLDVIGKMTPKVSAGPLTVQAIVTATSFECNIGFSVGLLNKVLKQQFPEKLTTQKEMDAYTEREVAKKELKEASKNLDNVSKNSDDPIEQANAVANLNEAQEKYDAADAAWNEAANTAPITGGNQAQNITTPNKNQMSDVLNTAKNSAKAFDKDTAALDKLLDALTQADSYTDKRQAVAARDAVVKSKGSIGMNLGMTFGITFKFVAGVSPDNPEEGTWLFDNAMVYGQVGFAISGVFYITIPGFPIPMYAGFGFSTSLGLYNGIQSTKTTTLNDLQIDPKSLVYKGNIPISIGIEGFVGAGIRKLLSLEFDLGFLQQFNLGFGPGTSGTGTSTFYGAFEINLVFLNFNWKFLQQSWDYTLYNVGSVQAAVDEAMQGFDPKLSEMEVNTKDYENSFYVPGTGEVTAVSAAEQTNRYDLVTDSVNMRTNVVPLGGGKYFTAFEGIDSSRDKYNRNAVYYSIYDGSDWSTPEILQNDGTIDTGLNVDDFGDKIMISWTSADKTFTEDDFTELDIESQDEEFKIPYDSSLKMLSSLDVCSVVIDKNAAANGIPEESITQVTKNTDTEDLFEWGLAHESPHAVQLPDGRIVLFYTTVDYNEYGGDKITTLSQLLSVPGVTMYRIYENGAWSETYSESEEGKYGDEWYGQRILDVNLSDPEGMTTYYPLAGQTDMISTIYEGENKILAAYVVDGDNNLATSTDRTVFMSVLTPGSDNSMLTSAPINLSGMADVSHPRFVKSVTDEFGEVNMIVWAQNGELRYLNLDKMFGDYDFGNESESIPDEDKIMLEKSEITLPNGNKIPSYTLKDGYHAGVAIYNDPDPETGEVGMSYGNGYTVVNGEDGNVYVLWPQSTGDEQKLMISTLTLRPNENGTYDELWRIPREFSLESENDEEREYVDNPSAGVDENGNMVILYNDFDMVDVTTTDEDGNEIMAGKTRDNNDLCAAHFTSIGSLEFTEGSIALSNDYPKADEEFSVTAEVENTGLLASKSVNAKAEIVETAADGSENVVQTVDASSEDMLLAGGKTEITAYLDMTQDMIDKALAGASYKAVLTVSEPGSTETSSAEAPIRVGTRLDIGSINVISGRSHEIKGIDENGSLIRGDVNGSVFVVDTEITNSGNVEASNPRLVMEIENQNVLDDPNAPDMDTASVEEIQEYLENAPQNASVVNSSGFTPYTEVGWMDEDGDIEPIGVEESTTVRIHSMPITDDKFSANKAAGFMLEVYDGEKRAPLYDEAGEVNGEGTYNLDAFNVNAFKSFTGTIPEEDVPLALNIRQDGNDVEQAEVGIGGTLSLEAGILPLAAAADSNVTWSSSNENIAKVGINGDVTGIGSGTAAITAAIDGTELVDSVTVNVKESSGGQSPGGQSPSGGGGIGGGSGTFGTGNATPTPTPSEEPQATAEPPKELPFADVNPTDWFYDDVKYAYENGLMNGVSDTEFDPNANITRGMFVTVLYRMDGSPEGGTSSFADVPADAYYHDAVAWASANGIVNGYSDTEYGPEDDILREQMATMLYRYAAYKDIDTSVKEDTNILSYTDAGDISEYAIPAIQWACGTGLMSGNGDGTLTPLSNAIRAEAAAVFGRFDKTFR